MIKEQKSETPYHKGDTKMDYNKLALEMHEQNKGKIAVRSKVTVKTRDDLSTAYTPGVAEPCRKIRDNKEEVYRYTAKGNLVAVVSDGTAVLGLGDIGPEAAMPVMEGKALLFKEFADIDAFPICLDTKDTEEIIKTVKNIAPCFGGINLEDISAPRCFEIEKRLKEEIKKQLLTLDNEQIMFKLTLPSQDDFYKDLLTDTHIVRIVALSGGYSREQANALLAKNHGIIASFSRALTQGLQITQTQEAFDALLKASIVSIYEASIT